MNVGRIEMSKSNNELYEENPMICLYRQNKELKNQIKQLQEENKQLKCLHERAKQCIIKLEKLLDKGRIIKILADPRHWCPSKAEQARRQAEKINGRY